jgi:integrase
MKTIWLYCRVGKLREDHFMSGGVRKRDGRWIGLWREQGVQKSKVIGFCTKMTKTEAREAVAEIVKRARDSTNPELFGSFVEGPFLSFYSRKWKGSTKSKSTNRIEVHLVREFRDCELGTFRRDALQDFLDRKATTLSFSMVNHLRWDLKQIFDMAQAEGLVRSNPALLLFTPKEAKRKDRFVLSAQQATTMFKRLGTRERLVAKLAVLSGMRPGEILALRWADVKETFVEVRQRVYEGVLDTPKTERGFRKVGLSPGVQTELQNWREMVGPSDSEKFVFASEKGTPLGKQNIWNRNMRPQLKLADLEWANFQVMRRTFSTLGKAAGGDPKALADQAGHDIGVSINVYMQTPLEGKLELVRNLEKFVLG